MLQINKMRADHVLDFAAEELKKYLRMMMPECGDITITYEPGAKEGFRLGLLSDFGFDASEVSDPQLDDLLHIDTDELGGVIAGSNNRSVLLAVYRYLTENGCRWLYPGVDGECIPLKNVVPIRYHKLADHRFRGFCNEGSESQQCMLETIDFYPKLGLNVYMLEFDTPYYYYDRYYSHKGNDAARPPEPVTKQQVKQWKRMCEAEIAKRGLQFHDMGHGWTAEPFGFDSSSGWIAEKQEIPEQKRKYLAQINGKREFFRGIPLLTNVCMSNPEVRSIMVKSIADYAETHQNVDYLHVWLADDCKNHCECEACSKMRPSDYYMMIMNELDAELTLRKLDTRIVFISYVDTMWGPETIHIRNPNRFSLLIAGGSYYHLSSVKNKKRLRHELPFIRNAWRFPDNGEEQLGLIQSWKKTWTGPCFSYEYHFWKEQVFDPGAMTTSRKIYDDLRGLREIGIDGFVEDGSQRSFFPNGLSVYVYAQTLFDQSLSYEEIRKDYMLHAYGGDWEVVASYLQKISRAFDFDYMSGLRSEDPAKHKYYAPSRTETLKQISARTEEGIALTKAHPVSETRPQAVSWRLLLLHAEYCRLLGEVFAEKSAGNDHLAWERFLSFMETFGRHEYEIERYYDQGLTWQAFKSSLFVSDDKSFVEGL